MRILKKLLVRIILLIVAAGILCGSVVAVLGFDTHTGNFISLLGRADFDPQGLSIEEIIQRAAQP